MRRLRDRDFADVPGEPGHAEDRFLPIEQRRKRGARGRKLEPNDTIRSRSTAQDIGGLIDSIGAREFRMPGRPQFGLRVCLQRCRSAERQLLLDLLAAGRVKLPALLRLPAFFLLGGR
jgi:hypothetical protein